MRNVSIQELKKIPIKTKINSVWSELNDNVSGDWDSIMSNVHGIVCWFLSKVSKFYDLEDIKTIFDIGSLNGAESYFFGQILPHCKVYSFEANPKSAKMVIDNQKEFSDRLMCVQKAVTNYDGTADFHITRGNVGASSLLVPTGGPAGTDFEKVTVECTTIDSFCKQNFIDKVDLVWMDLQGNELNALKGMGEYIHNIKAIHTEVGNQSYYIGQSLHPEITNYLSQQGFIKYPEAYQCGSNWEEDVLYIRKR